MRAGLVIATCEHVELALLAVSSAVRHAEGSPWALAYEDVYLYDDGVRRPYVWDLARLFPDIHIEHSALRQGCTPGWNAGLRWLRDRDVDLAVVANDDVLFAPGWVNGLAQGLESYDLVGPVTNAPGTANPAQQGVWAYVPGYQPSDHPGEIAQVAAALLRSPVPPLPSPVNGFCMAARTSTWFSHGWSADEVFNPAFPMGGNEDDYQRRARKQGLRSAVCPTSFVFHYRAMSRGPAYVRDMYYRPGGDGCVEQWRSSLTTAIANGAAPASS